jgi:glucan 1,3-beta-glucosidase
MINLNKKYYIKGLPMKIFALLKTLKAFGLASKVCLLLVTYFALSACGGDMTSGPNTSGPAKPAFAEPAPREETFSKLRAEGTIWMNEQDEKVSLRGVNLGNWLMMEMWMFGNDQVFGQGIVDQCTFEDALVARFGEAEKDRLFKVHRDSWMTEKDWDFMEDAGFNVVRIPFPYDLIEDDDNPKTLKPDAWHYLDWSIGEAKERKMYVILDLHGAAGRQGWEHHSGCAGKNELWGSQTYRDRTIWLWEQIAQKYKDEDAIAGYGLLNEAWGASPKVMSEFGIDLYHAVRRYDNEHIVILPGHSEDGGFTVYGDPLDSGMENVAFEMHYYPGIFGWGDIGYKTHRDWLDCGASGVDGICSVAKRAQDAYTPLLIGELQPWTSLGELGGEITRATFDRYNELNWAATAWSLKTVTPSGGQGAGRWGLMTNKGDQLLVKSTTWACDDWESSFADACDISARSTVPNTTTETQTMYLVLKTGSFKGTDVVFDEIELTNDETGENIIVNGSFGNAGGWQAVTIQNSLPVIDYNYAAGEFAGNDTGAALRISAPNGDHNFALYQAIQVDPGASYTISGKFKDLIGGVTELWAEVYLVPEQPQQGVDVLGTVLKAPNVNLSTAQEFETYFSLFSDMDYEINHWVVDALTREEPARVYNNIPASPSNFHVKVSDENNTLTWTASEGEVDGYRVYRSTSSSTGFNVVAELGAEVISYTDAYGGADGLDPDVTYYYYITGYNSSDESYSSKIKATGKSIYLIPGKFEAENFADSHPGVKSETVGDSLGGGLNIGHFETDRWVEYNILATQSATYTADFRLASLVGDVQFEIRIDDETVGTVTVPNTGGWQDYQTVSLDVDIPSGESVLRLHSLDNQWNLNWVEFNLSDSQSAGSDDTGADDSNGMQSNPASMAFSFGGSTIDEGESDNLIYTFPLGAESWAGFANENEELYPIIFTEAGFISFNAAVPSGGSADVRFRFEKNPHPDVDPAYDTNPITVTGSEEKNYTIVVPSQDDKQFRNIVMYVDTRDEPVALKDIVVTSSDSGVVDQDDSNLVEDPDADDETNKYVLNNPTSSTITHGSNANVSVVTDTELSKDVAALEVVESSNFDQGYVGFPLSQEDFSAASAFEFKVLDQQGSNTVYITLVDSTGAKWSGWSSDETRTVLNAWTSIEFDYTAAANSIDLTKVSEVRFAQWNAGTYRFADVALLLSSGAIEIDNSNADQSSNLPQSIDGYTFGTNATGSVVADDELSKDVVELQVLQDGNFEQAYVSFPYSQQDFSTTSSLEFHVLDQQGENTVYITLVDDSGASWSGWSSDEAKTALNTWKTIEFDYSAAVNSIDLTKVSEVRFAQWNAGTYRFADVALVE